MGCGLPSQQGQVGRAAELQRRDDADGVALVRHDSSWADSDWFSCPRTQRSMRQQSGQSPSTPIQVKSFSAINRRLSSARHV